MTRVPQTFGLSAARAVQMFLAGEPGLKREIVAFFLDERDGPRPDILNVAGPPPLRDVIAAKKNPKAKVLVPVISFRLRKTVNLTTGERGVEVTCSDADLETLTEWLRHPALRYAVNQRRAA